jgi:hypothetical protein
MWEILVPASNNKDLKFTFEHHKEWDEYVKEIAGGITIHRPAKGEWVSPDGKLYKDRVIPVRIMCTEAEIEKIIAFTISWYKQEAVLAYEISNHVKLRYKNDY